MEHGGTPELWGYSCEDFQTSSMKKAKQGQMLDLKIHDFIF